MPARTKKKTHDFSEALRRLKLGKPQTMERWAGSYVIRCHHTDMPRGKDHAYLLMESKWGTSSFWIPSNPELFGEDWKDAYD